MEFMILPGLITLYGIIILNNIKEIMITLNKTTNKYLKQLLSTGILYLLVGIWASFILSKGIEKDSFFDLTFAVIGMILGYMSVTKFDPGGHTNFTLFNFNEKSPDREKFNEMIIFYKSNLLIRLITILVFIFVVRAYILTHTLAFSFNLNTFVWLIFWNFLTVGLLGTGIKYISAWWNIKRNMK